VRGGAGGHDGQQERQRGDQSLHRKPHRKPPVTVFFGGRNYSTAIPRL
jgi:hypothetical protein